MLTRDQPPENLNWVSSDSKTLQFSLCETLVSPYSVLVIKISKVLFTELLPSDLVYLFPEFKAPASCHLEM